MFLYRWTKVPQEMLQVQSVLQKARLYHRQVSLTLINLLIILLVLSRAHGKQMYCKDCYHKITVLSVLPVLSRINGEQLYCKACHVQILYLLYCLYYLGSMVSSCTA